MKLENVMFATRQSSSVRRPLRQARRISGKPAFEMLEERQHFSVYTVNSTADIATPASSPQHTLVDAINQVNAGNDNVIDFNVPKTDPGYNASTGMWTMKLTSQLPMLEQAVTIDGYSQPGHTNSPLIEINGDNIPSSPAGVYGLIDNGGNTTIRGLSMDNFNTAISINDQAGGDVIDGNTFGANLGNRGLGTAIDVEDASHCTIGQLGQANDIYFATAQGIYVHNSSYDSIAYNVIGGRNTGVGIVVTGISTSTTIADNQILENTIGVDLSVGAGYSTVTGNVVSNCTTTGIEVDGFDTTISSNKVSGTGTSSASGGDGILITGNNNTVTGNTFTFNEGYGVDLGSLNGIASSYDTVQGNTISDNSYGGVSVSQGSIDDAILSNSISCFGGVRGINLNNGGNNGQAAPVITSAEGNTSLVSVVGTVHSLADTTVRVELFASPAGDTQQGQTYLGAETVTTDILGNASFSDALFGNYIGDVITATATVTRVSFNPTTHLITFGEETSEFSNSQTAGFLIPVTYPRIPLIDW